MSDDLQERGAPTIDQARFREVLGHFATGITVVTAMEDGAPVGFTCQAFTSLSLTPPLVALGAGQVVDQLAPDRPGRRVRRQHPLGAPRGPLPRLRGAWRRQVQRRRLASRRAGTPILDGALAWVECELGIVHDAGDHELVTGRVLDLGVGEGAPLLFYRGGFGRFAV